MTKVLNAGELVLIIIVRDNGVAKCHCVRRNEQIIPIKSVDPAFSSRVRIKPYTLSAGISKGRTSKAPSTASSWAVSCTEPLLVAPWRNSAANDDAGADLVFSNLADMLRDSTLRVANEIRNDIRVEQEAHQRSTGSG